MLHHIPNQLRLLISTDENNSQVNTSSGICSSVHNAIVRLHHWHGEGENPMLTGDQDSLLAHG
jgi:hypothetical protein